jgi:Flp pilus assembly protein TadD
MAAQLAPAQAAPHFDIARTLAELGRLDEAADEYRQTLRLAPSHRGALDGLAGIAPR